MNSATLVASVAPSLPGTSRPAFDHKPSIATIALFVALLIGGAAFTVYSLTSDFAESGAHPTTYLPFFLLVAMATIGAADMFGLPVSTTHVVSSGVAGTMAANKSGLQWTTIRNLLMAWVLTLPMAIVLSGSLYWLFTRLF